MGQSISADEPCLSGLAIPVPTEAETSGLPLFEGGFPVDAGPWIRAFEVFSLKAVEAEDVTFPDSIVDGEAKEPSRKPTVVFTDASLSGEGTGKSTARLVEMGEGFAELADEPGFSESVLAGDVAEAAVGIDQIDLLWFN